MTKSAEMVKHTQTIRRQFVREVPTNCLSVFDRSADLVHLLKKSLMKNIIFVHCVQLGLLGFLLPVGSLFILCKLWWYIKVSMQFSPIWLLKSPPSTTFHILNRHLEPYLYYQKCTDLFETVDVCYYFTGNIFSNLDYYPTPHFCSYPVYRVLKNHLYETVRVEMYI